jgi:hypothetical protein
MRSRTTTSSSPAASASTPPILTSLDQLGDPVVRRGRDGGTDIISPREARPAPQWPFRRDSGSGPFALAPSERVARLASVPGADTVRDLATTARRRMLEDGIDPVSRPTYLADTGSLE